jgi:effector-binding domain-containing protein
VEGEFMSFAESGITHRKLAEKLVATVRLTVKERSELRAAIDKLASRIPREIISGPPFAIWRFVSDVVEGNDYEIGFPLIEPIELDGVEVSKFPAMDVLCLTHKGPLDEFSNSLGSLFGCAYGHGLASDEFMREEYPDWADRAGDRVELQFVIHDWEWLFEAGLSQLVGEEMRQRVMQGNDELSLESTVDERFTWVKGAMETLDEAVSEEQKCDIVSGCAHVFPRELIAQLKAVFESARTNTDDPLQAVDAVIEFMGDERVWGPSPRRDGNTIYAVKNPRDPQGYEAAETDAERRKAYCFCPLIRNHLDDGMPITFCYCGAGWYRQQWEGAVGRPVKIEVVKSVLKGDDECQFAVHLPDDL